MKIINKYWSVLSLLGVKKSMPFYLQKQVMLCNQIHIGLFMTLWVYATIDFIIVRNPTRIFLGLAIMSMILIPLFLNFFHLTTISRVFASGFFSVLMLSMFISAKIFGQPPSLLFYIIPRFGLLCCAVMPFLLLDSKYEKKLFITCVCLNALCLIFFDPLHALFGVSFQQLGGKIDFYPMITINSLVLLIVMMLAFIFFKNTTTIYEKKLRRFNQRLNQKNKMIRHQNRTLNQQNQEIVRQNEELSLQQEEIMSINNQLEDLVSQRTQKLQERNQQLNEYAFLNSHKLRAPVATILGLYHILDMSQTEPERNFILSKIKESIETLDAVVHKMQQLLEEQDLANVNSNND